MVSPKYLIPSTKSTGWPFRSKGLGSCNMFPPQYRIMALHFHGLKHRLTELAQTPSNVVSYRQIRYIYNKFWACSQSLILILYLLIKCPLLCNMFIRYRFRLAVMISCRVIFGFSYRMELHNKVNHMVKELCVISAGSILYQLPTVWTCVNVAPAECLLKSTNTKQI